MQRVDVGQAYRNQPAARAARPKVRPPPFRQVRNARTSVRLAWGDSKHPLARPSSRSSFFLNGRISRLFFPYMRIQGVDGWGA